MQISTCAALKLPQLLRRVVKPTPRSRPSRELATMAPPCDDHSLARQVRSMQVPSRCCNDMLMHCKLGPLMCIIIDFAHPHDAAYDWLKLVQSCIPHLDIPTKRTLPRSLYLGRTYHGICMCTFPNLRSENLAIIVF